MVFAGDIHQVINPTFFSEERIRKLYYSRNRNRSPVHISFLKKNYRSQDKIVDFANELAEIRKRRIGSRSLQSELSEESAIEGWRPFLLNASESNIKQIVNRVNELPYAFELLELIANDTDDTEIEKFCRGCAAIMVQESLEGTRTVLNYAENALRDDSLTCKLVRKISETTVYALMAATERLNKEMPDE